MMSRSLLSASNGENSASVEAPSIVRNGGSCEIMLFGVRVKVDPMRKSVSMNNLSEYEQPQELANYAAADISASASAIVATGYASADDAAHHQSAVSRERKRGVPWTEEEHKLFLLGLQTVGKGDWRGIARNFVKTRTSTQVASHAQKYFLRRSNLNRRRRRSSLFDITTDSVTAIPMEEEFIQQDNLIRPVMQQREHPNLGEIPTAPYPMQINKPLETLALGNADQLNNAPKALIHPLSFFPIPNPPPPASIELNSGQELTIENSPLSLNLSLSSNHQHQMSSRHSTFQAMPSFSNGNGDSVISVA